MQTDPNHSVELQPTLEEIKALLRAQNNWEPCEKQEQDFYDARLAFAS
jgi:hypothetical protein